MKILAFGVIGEVIGAPHIEVNEVFDTDMLYKYLILKYPVLKNQQFVMAIESNIIRERQALNGKESVALLPPFSGG